MVLGERLKTLTPISIIVYFAFKHTSTFTMSYPLSSTHRLKMFIRCNVNVFTQACTYILHKQILAPFSGFSGEEKKSEFFASGMRFIVTAAEEGMLNVQLERLLAVGGNFFALSHRYRYQRIVIQVV